MKDRTRGVMAHWYSPLWDLGTQKRSGFKPSGVQVKLLADPLLMSLTWGCQQLVRSGLLLCFKRKKEKRKKENDDLLVFVPVK
jgi:hypothetical protein